MSGAAATMVGKKHFRSLVAVWRPVSNIKQQQPAQAAQTAPTTHIIPSVPPPVPRKARSRRSEPFDANLLCSKLEAAILQQDDSQPQRRSQRASLSGPGYVPRNAARQFASTTTPLPPDQQSKLPQRAKSLHGTKAHIQRVDAYQSGMNPKQLMASLSIGMSESEAMAMVEQPRRQPSKSKRRSLPPSTKIPTDSDRATSKASTHPTGSQPTSYRPAEASARNQKRRSLQHSAAVNQALESAASTDQPPASLPSIASHQYADLPEFLRCPLDGVPEFRQLRDMDNEMPYLMPMDDGPAVNARGSVKRPKLPEAHDRNDWCQRSQCSDDMRLLLSRPLGRKKHQRAQRAGEKKNTAGGSGVEQAQGKPDALVRRRSHEDSVDEQRLGGNGFRLEEKNSRRQSLFNPLRKLLH